jgi:oligopeptide/dipeptide ABC transporter ATP-binding protein
VLRIGDQIAEVLRAHNSWNKAKCREETMELLRCVQLGDDSKIYYAYPHQISGGQQQRVVIGQALACRPEMLIADEPTASLDESMAAGILDVLKSAVEERNMSLLLITHTPGLLTQIAQRVLVMYGGRVIEEATVAELFREPLHPYTKALLQCSNPGLSRADTSQGVRFSTIEGDAPNLELPIAGCSFAARCEKKLNNCTENPPAEIHFAKQRKVECFLYAE